MKNINWKKLLLQVGIYCFGLLVLAFGVAFSVNSDLGVSPVNSMPYVFSQIFNVSMGTCVTVVFCGFILLQALILRKEFSLISLTQILFSTAFGYFVDFAKLVLGDFCLPTYVGRLGMLAISIVLIAVGIYFYLLARLVPMPMEGLAMAISKKAKKPFTTMKTVTDSVAVALAAILAIVFLGRLDGVREGTLISALVIGKVIALIKKPLKPLEDRIWSEENKNEREKTVVASD